MRKMRGLTAAAVTACCLIGAGAIAAQAQDSPPPPTAPEALERCAFVSYDGGDTETCTLQVTSFDGAPLDVDITRPARSEGGRRHELIAMLHGFGGDKSRRPTRATASRTVTGTRTGSPSTATT